MENGSINFRVAHRFIIIFMCEETVHAQTKKINNLINFIQIFP